MTLARIPPEQEDLAPLGLVKNEAERFRAALASVLARLNSPHSRRAYEGDWRAWSEWCDTNGVYVLTASPLDVQSFAQTQAVSGAKKTVERRLTVLRQVYGALVVHGLLSTNPAREVKTPRVDRPRKTPWLNSEGLAKLLRVAGEKLERRDRLIVLCLAGLGLRRVEVAGLTWDKLVPTPAGLGLTTVVKGGKIVTVGVPPTLAGELAAWRKEVPGPSLWTKDGHIPDGELVYEVVRKAAALAGLECTPHALRRTLATLASLQGTPLAEIQATLGHSRASTTEGYLQDSRLPARAVGEAILGEALKKP